MRYNFITRVKFSSIFLFVSFISFLMNLNEHRREYTHARTQKKMKKNGRGESTARVPASEYYGNGWKVNTRIFGLLKRRKIGQVPRERQGNWTTRRALVTGANLKENLNMGNKGNLKGPQGKRGGRGDTKARGGGCGGGGGWESHANR